MPEVRLIDANALQDKIRYTKLRVKSSVMMAGFVEMKAAALREIENAPTIESEPVRHGRWIECDYKHMEHGMIETEPKAGFCCSECHTAFQKKKMTYKQYCAACGARMDGGAENG